MKLNEIVSSDKKHKAWLQVDVGLNSSAYQFIVQRTGIFGRLAKQSVSLGTEYYDPSSQFQYSDMPIGRTLQVDSITLSETTAELKYIEILQFARKPSTKTPETCSINLRKK